MGLVRNGGWRVRTSPAWNAPRRSEDPSCAPPVHLHSTYTSKLFALCMFRLSSESITLQLAKTQCLTDGRDCSGSNFVLIHGYYRRARVTTAQLHVDSNSPFLHHSSTARTLRTVGHLASNSRIDGGGKVSARQRLHYSSFLKKTLYPLLSSSEQECPFYYSRLSTSEETIARVKSEMRLRGGGSDAVNGRGR